jgi:hypothetical protein
MKAHWSIGRPTLSFKAISTLMFDVSTFSRGKGAQLSREGVRVE